MAGPAVCTSWAKRLKDTSFGLIATVRGAILSVVALDYGVGYAFAILTLVIRSARVSIVAVYAVFRRKHAALGLVPSSWFSENV